MAKIYTVAQLQQLYARLEQRGVTTHERIEQQALAFANAFTQLYRSGSLIHIFAGSEETGAVALAVSRLLHERGRRLRVYLFYTQGKISEECQRQHKLLSEEINLEEITARFDPPRFESGQIIIDGLFGSDNVLPLEGGFASLVQMLNASGLDIVSIDLPSGLFADDNASNTPSNIIRARHTLTFETPKLSMLLSENAPYLGQWRVLPLSWDSEVHRSLSAEAFTSDEIQLDQILRKRKPFAPSHSYGRSLFLGTDPSLLGRLALSMGASLTAGIDEVALWEEEPLPLLYNIIPELRLLTGKIPSQEELRKYQSIALGVATSRGSLGGDLLRNVLSLYPHSVVLMGDLIRQLSEDTSLHNYLGERSILIVTPEERVSLLGSYSRDLNYIERAQSFATKHKTTLLILGTYPLVCRPSGKLFFGTNGNAGLARQGTAEVLAGLLTGLLARGYDLLTASLLSIHITGLSADRYVARHSMETLTPSRLLAELEASFAELYT